MSRPAYIRRWASVFGALPALCLGIGTALGQTPSGPRKPGITALCPTPDGTAVVIGSQAGVVVRRLSDGAERPIATELEQVHAAAFSPDGRTLALAGGSPARAGVVELWTAAGDKRLARLQGHVDSVYDVAWTDRSTLATAGADRAVKLYSAEGKHLADLTGHSGPVLCLAVSPDGKLLCSGAADQTIRVWDIAERRPVRSLNNHLAAVQALAYRPGTDPKRPAYLASVGADNTLRIWQPSIGRMVRIVRRPTAMFAVAWAADGSRVFAAGGGGTIAAVDADSDRVLFERTPTPYRITALTVVAGRPVWADAAGNAQALPPDK